MNHPDSIIPNEEFRNYIHYLRDTGTAMSHINITLLMQSNQINAISAGMRPVTEKVLERLVVLMEERSKEFNDKAEAIKTKTLKRAYYSLAKIFGNIVEELEEALDD